MFDTLTIGPVPSVEQCEQLGRNYDARRAKQECRAFMAQLIREFGAPPYDADLVITSNPHDFGTYHEVAVRYNEDDRAALEYAFKLEGNTPAEWDTIARQELGLDD